MKRIAAKCLGKPGSGREAQLWQTTFKGKPGFILQLVSAGPERGKVTAFSQREGETEWDLEVRATKAYGKAV